MMLPKTFSRTLAGTALVVALCPLHTGAYAAPLGDQAACEHGPGGPPGTPGGPRPMEHRPGPGEMDLDASRPPPYLHDADLSDEQEDKVFAIVHAAAPGLREQTRLARKAHESLRQLAHAPKFDETAASNLSSAEAKAQTQAALMRVRVDHDLYAVLTPEQRKRVEEREHDHAEHRPGGPPRG